MGLDINFYSMPKSYDLGDLSFLGYEYPAESNDWNPKWYNDENIVDTSYFRKNYDLHEWMKKFFVRKGGKNDEYGDLLNLCPVKISIQDLNQIRDDFRHEEYVMPDHDFKILKQELEKGRVVYYYASY